MIKVFGIRHHGAGSSRSLRNALEQFEPDCILIESPGDAIDALPHAADPEIKLPVAILIFDPKNLNAASYLPYAEFSPEWVTMQFGFEREIPIKFMDLPLGYQFALNAAEKSQIQLFPEGELVEPDAENEDLGSTSSPSESEDPSENKTPFQKTPLSQKRQMHRDPLGEMAKLAGYSDSERWWEITFEQTFNPIEIFVQIAEMISALRENQREERLDTLRREAFMRITLRQAIKDGFEKIAVVCGAWHVPAIIDYQKHKQSADKSFLKGLKKIKTKSTWIPWSYERLAVDSGYGAGIKSPAWYDLLFHHRENASIHWMSKVSQLLREEGLDASSAHAVEAVRLAETLATMRGLQLPGIDELKEAAITVFGNGNHEPLDWIERKLVIGEKYGEVPDSVPQVPLQKDLEATIKTARLTKDRNSVTPVEKKFDLRKKTNLIASQLLHRLNILDIPWGKMQDEAEFATGSFSEHWILKWLPDFAIQIIEAGMWGNTVPEAATRKLLNKSKEEKQLSKLTEMVASSLLAELPQAIPALIYRLREISTLTEDALHLAEALPSLVRVLRYGNVRKTDTEQVRAVVEEFVPRLCIGLPSACVNLDEENSKEIFEKILAANHALSILNNKKLQKHWILTLRQIAAHPGIHPILQGACVRILFEKKIFSIKDTATKMRYALSPGNEAAEAASWLEGFLHGSGLLLIHNPSFWQILDEWVDEIDPNIFKEILPLLRRTFSKFPGAERTKMLELAKQIFNKKEEKNTPANIDTEAIEIFLPTIRQLLN